MYVHTHIYIYTHTHTHIYTYICVFIYINEYYSTPMYMHWCVYVKEKVCALGYMCEYGLYVGTCARLSSKTFYLYACVFIFVCIYHFYMDV